MSIFLDEQPESSDPVHLLVVADSKIGKSVYAAQAAIDGFEMIYIDGDNGKSALNYALKDKPEAKRRVRYLGTRRPADFMRYFLKSTTAAPMLWMPDKNQVYHKLLPGLADDDRVWRIDASVIPKEWLVNVDSWTAVAADALGIGSAEQKAELLDGTDQGIYGTANSLCTYICNLLQKVPYHVCVQAHGTRFEVYDKPNNMKAGGPGGMTQKDMILRETKDVPASCSRPHGETMASRFNHIGWMNVTPMGTSEIDFTRKPTRVGGGPPNRKALVTDLTFTKLVGGVPPTVVCTEWFKETTHGELKK